MSFITRTVLLLALLYGVSVATVHAGDDWKIEIEKEHISVYSRNVADSKILEIRAVTEMRSSLSGIVSLLNEVDALPQWVPNSGGARIVEQVAQNERLVYGIIDIPWPITDRDTVVYFLVTQDPQTRVVTVRMTGQPTYLPESENYVRVPLLSGFWRIAPVKEGLVEVTYQIHAEPGGLLPAWLVNAFAAQNVYNTVKNMRRIIKKEKYTQTRLDYIEEPKR